MKTLSLIASTGITLVLLAACGGGGSPSSSPIPSPAPAPAPTPTPTPAPTPTPTASFPKDYQLPYLAPTRGIYTVSANATGSSTLRSNIQPLLSTQIDDGEWSNGVLVSKRPHALVFLDASDWKTLSLRTAGSQAVSSTAFRETRMVCRNTTAQSFSDYAAPQNSLVFYQVDGGDGVCGTTDDLTTGFRLGGSGNINLGNLLPRLAFRNNVGGITSYLVQVGSDLRLYAPGASNFTVAATGIVGEVREVAITATAAWMVWNTGSNYSIYRVGADGTRSAPLYSASLFIYPGANDTSAMYVSHLVSDTESSIVRVPYSGSSAVLATGNGVSEVVAATNSALLLLNFASNVQSARFQVLAKTGGTPVLVSATSPNQTPLPFSQTLAATSSNQFLLNLYEGDGNTRVDTTAVLVNEQGQIVERFAKSQWIGTALVDRDFSKQTKPVARKALQVQSYTGTGHQGGMIVMRDFGTGARNAVTSLTAAGTLQARSDATPADLATFLSSVGNGNTDIDIFGFDLDTLVFTRLTNTPSIQESIP